ncbi:putative membrane protein C6F6.13c 1 [Colletotrichum chlorophyti]|uniref:Putative membrane protein C6F6.13c 1 n=1 Tax=Colletotrichum chlorophyti TaxID=708187 RepID=A0A1Q8RYY1_9PEZI|nr:putative membrane protein C6F6.13c 1 [Colletotrichum chlorophyti]
MESNRPHSPSPAAPAAGQAAVAQEAVTNVPPHNHHAQSTNTDAPPVSNSQPPESEHNITTCSSDLYNEDQYDYAYSDDDNLDASSICSFEIEEDGNWERDPDQENMGGSRRPHGSRRRTQTDLTGVLTIDEKNELVNLVNNITDNMRDRISDLFDSPPITPVETEDPQHSWLSLSLLKGKSSNRPAASKSQTNANKENANTSSQQYSGKAYSKAHEIVEKEEEEAMTPQLQELKKECLVVFKKWQGNVLTRVKDISVKEAVEPAAPVARGGRGRGPRGGRGDRGVSQGGRGAPRGRGGRGAALSVRTGSSPDTRHASQVDPWLGRRYPPTATTLTSLPVERRKLFLHTILLLLLSLEQYTAFSRVFMLNLASSLHLSLRFFQEDEVRVARGLGKSVQEVNADEVMADKAEENKSSRRWKVGLAGAAGAAIIGVTGGLAAPLVAAGIGTVMGGVGLGTTAAAGLLGTLAQSGVVVGSLFGIYGARQTSKMMDQYARDVADFAFLPLHGDMKEEYRDAKEIAPKDRRLRVVLALSGWLTQKEDVINPWRCIGHQGEVYAVRWEVANLMNMGNSLETVIKSTAWGVAKKEIITRTIFSSLMSAMWPIGLLKVSKVIDNPWSVGMVRAEKVGMILAEAISRKVQGDRPVSLIGYSLAARAIYTCLMVLAERRQFGLIESVVMIGTPAPSESRVWLALKSVVSGRLVNVYSENDYILGFLYRTSNLQFGVAGLQKIQGAEGVENYDVSRMVSGHLRYQYMIGTILKNIGWEDLDYEQIKKDEHTLRLMDEKFGGDKSQKTTYVDMDKEAEQIQEEVNHKNDTKLASRMSKMKIQD